jgi:hypothetical protein
MNKLEYRTNIIEYHNLLNYEECKILINKNQKKIINKGATADIYKIDSPKCGSIILKNINNTHSKKLISNEVIYLEMIKKIIMNDVCPNFILMYNYTTTNIIMEYADGDLSSIIGKIDDSETIKNIYFQIILGILIMQKVLFINHTDLHLKNIFYKKIHQKIKYFEYKINNKSFYLPNLGYLIMIADFGRSKKLSSEEIKSDNNKDYNDFISLILIENIYATFYMKQPELINKILIELAKSDVNIYKKFIDYKPETTLITYRLNLLILVKILLYVIDNGLFEKIRYILQEYKYNFNLPYIAIIIDLIKIKNISLITILNTYFASYIEVPNIEQNYIDFIKTFTIKID